MSGATLRQIRRRGDPSNTSWYKRDSSCPNDDGDLHSSYLDAFDCALVTQPGQRYDKSKRAKTCASERMAEMHHRILSNMPVDQGHVYPILLAYGLGRQCLRTPQEFAIYDTDFERWYNELIENTSRLNPAQILFQSKLGNKSILPFKTYNPNINHGVIAARSRQTRRSIENKRLAIIEHVIPKDNNWQTVKSKRFKKTRKNHR